MLSKQTKIICDRCPAEFCHDPNLTAEQQREEAKKAGWGNSSSTDICPDCFYKNGRGNKAIKRNTN